MSTGMEFIVTVSVKPAEGSPPDDLIWEAIAEVHWQVKWGDSFSGIPVMKPERYTTKPSQSRRLQDAVSYALTDVAIAFQKGRIR